MSNFLLSIFLIAGGVFVESTDINNAANDIAEHTANNKSVDDDIVSEQTNWDVPKNTETDTDTSSHIITAESATSVRDTFSLSKHLEFFTSNYRNFIEKYNPPEISDSVYKMRLDSLGKGMAVPLVYNSKVKNYIKAYTNNKRKQVNVMLSLGQYYFPLFEEVFALYGIPSELKYLAIIESALNPRATSRVGASGLWQFMYQTGQMYNLKVNPFVDERFDPVKATEAAAKYLRDLYNSFGDWTLVIAAYNCGPGNVNKAIRKAKGKTDFWKIYQFLPSETRNYVPAYIGAVYAMNYYIEHNIPAPANDFPMLTDTVVVDDDMDFNIIAQTLDLPLQTLRDLNPQYKQDVIPGGSHYYSLRLPVYIIPHYLEMKDTMAELFEETNREIVLSYRIKQHETLSGIASRFDVSVKDLITWNKLKSTTIYPNQVLQIHTTQKAIETIRARPKIKQDGRVDKVEPLLASTTTKPKPVSSRQSVASKAIAATSVSQTTATTAQTGGATQSKSVTQSKPATQSKPTTTQTSAKSQPQRTQQEQRTQPQVATKQVTATTSQQTQQTQQAQQTQDRKQAATAKQTTAPQPAKQAQTGTATKQVVTTNTQQRMQQALQQRTQATSTKSAQQQTQSASTRLPKGT
ncbi:MAG: transglycosylase SLT domain-containing protein, partial [Bacteroidales bacterium]|nr:transglycosylase SLT domain-containing protein [Bacteroidales bacterium]